jgi:hypothetical protein
MCNKYLVVVWMEFISPRVQPREEDDIICRLYTKGVNSLFLLRVC